MSETHCNLIYHLVFSTKARARFLTPDFRPKAHRYLAGAVQGVDGIPLIINGTEDHVHLLVKLSQNHALKNVLSEIKSNSSGWIHRQHQGLADFAWQVGCGAFRMLDAATAEIKRMYVRPAIRGTGTGRALLESLEERARALGAMKLVLESGPRQPAAIGLYSASGFVPVDAFGAYEASPLSTFMGKNL